MLFPPSCLYGHKEVRIKENREIEKGEEKSDRKRLN